jgi:hypothetical protein
MPIPFCRDLLLSLLCVIPELTQTTYVCSNRPRSTPVEDIVAKQSRGASDRDRDRATETE